MTTDVTGLVACDCAADRVPAARRPRARHRPPTGLGTWIVKSKRHVVAVGDLDATETAGPMRSSELCQGVTLVVMEATSVYWKPPFYLIEDDITCQVVNARDVKNVPGRPKRTNSTRCGCASSLSGACSGPRSSRPARSASYGT